MELKPLAERRSSLLQVAVVGSGHAINKKKGKSSLYCSCLNVQDFCAYDLVGIS